MSDIAFQNTDGVLHVIISLQFKSNVSNKGNKLRECRYWKMVYKSLKNIAAEIRFLSTTQFII